MAYTAIRAGDWQILKALVTPPADKKLLPDGEQAADGYLIETFASRMYGHRWSVEKLERLAEEGFLRFGTVKPNLIRRLFGSEEQLYLYITPLGREAVSNPVEYLASGEQLGEIPAGYEPQGMWLRQAYGLSVDEGHN